MLRDWWFAAAYAALSTLPPLRSPCTVSPLPTLSASGGDRWQRLHLPSSGVHCRANARILLSVGADDTGLNISTPIADSTSADDTGLNLSTPIADSTTHWRRAASRSGEC